MRQKSKYPVSSHGSTNCNSISGIATDVIEWMRHSGPRSLEEVALLRKGMRKNAVISTLFERQIHEGQTGRTLWHIKGHNGTLILASEKHIKFFRKALKQRERSLELDRQWREALRCKREAPLERQATVADDLASRSSPSAAASELPWS
jgi:hypothetical protein